MSKNRTLVRTLHTAAAGALLFHAAAHGVLPDKAKPKSASAAPAPVLTAPERVDPMQAILERFDITGEWAVEAQRRDKSVLRGTLAISGKRGAGSYSGVLTLSSHVTGLSVRQEADVQIEHAKVRVRGSNAALLRGTGPYDPDEFELSVVEPKILSGTARNRRGPEGSVLLIKK